MVVRLSGLEVCMSKGLVNWLTQYLTKKFATPLVAYPIQEMLAHLKMLFGNAPLNVCLWFPKYETGFTISNLLNTYASFWPHTPFCWSSLNKWEKRKYLMAVSIGQSSLTHLFCYLMQDSWRAKGEIKASQWTLFCWYWLWFLEPWTTVRLRRQELSSSQNHREFGR